MSNLLEALTVFREAVERHVKSSNDPLKQLVMLHQRAEHLLTRGDYPGALEAALRLRDLAVQHLDEGHPALADALQNLAVIYQTMGAYDVAEPLLRKALQIHRAALPAGDPDLAGDLENLGVVCLRTGRYDEAERLLQEALAVLTRANAESDAEFARVLNTLGAAYQERGDLQKALEQYKRAEAILRSEPSAEAAYAEVLNNLGTVYHELGDYSAAQTRYQQALHLRRRLVGKQHPLVAQSLHNLAALSRDTGRYPEAISLYGQARRLALATLGREHPSYATLLTNLAALHLWTNDAPEALKLLKEATQIEDRMIERLSATGSERQRLQFLATVHARYAFFLLIVIAHRSELPSDAPAAALDLVLRRKAVVAEVIARQREAVLGGHYPWLKPRLLELTRLREAIAASAWAGPGAEGLAAHERTLARREAQRDQLEDELSREIPEVTARDMLRRANRQRVAEAMPTDAALVELVRLLDANPVANEPSLDSGASLPPPGSYAAFILLGHAPDDVRIVYLGEGDEIDRLIARFRGAVSGRNEGSAARPCNLSSHSAADLSDTVASAARELATEPGHPAPLETVIAEGTALRRLVFDPLVPLLGQKTRLFLVPDGDLTRLPFESLPLENGKSLIDVYEISYLTSGRDVMHFGAQRSSSAAVPVVAADPDFDLAVEGSPPRGTPFRRLPGTRTEGELVAGMLEVAPLLDGAVLERTIKTHHSPRVLHLATHGFFLPDSGGATSADAGPRTRPVWGLNATANLDAGLRLGNPLLRSGLALAGANTRSAGATIPDEAEDGLLTAEDVAALDLLGTELVVLSACDTGLGQVRVGEGVFGLRRAFALAGARTLVMSLWKVPDQETEWLMVRFYRELKSGCPAADALRAAQVALKQDNPHPMYWGAFILQGDPLMSLAG